MTNTFHVAVFGLVGMSEVVVVREYSVYGFSSSGEEMNPVARKGAAHCKYKKKQKRIFGIKN